MNSKTAVMLGVGVIYAVLASSGIKAWFERPIECHEEAFRESVRQGGEIILPEACTIKLTQDLPPIETDISIKGQNSIIDGSARFRLFSSENADVTLDTLTIRHGFSAQQNGGAVFVRRGDVIITDSVFEANASDSEGGAVMVAAGNLVITGTVFKDNRAILGGGAVSMGDGSLTITASEFQNNGSIGCGAGIMVHQARTVITESAFFANIVDTHGGGALCLVSAEVEAEITNSTFSRNQAGRGGGGIAVNEGVATIIHCTITDNHAGRGGGIWSSGTINLQGSIVIGNAAEDGTEISMSMGTNPVLNSWGYNVVTPSAGLSLITSDRVSHTSGLEPLKDGMHLLSVDSLARNAIPPEDCTVETDQRGIKRPQGTGCDSGAVEVE